MIPNHTPIATRRLIEQFECTKALVFNYSHALGSLADRANVSAQTEQTIRSRLLNYKEELDTLRHTLSELGVDESTMKDHDPTLL